MTLEELNREIERMERLIFQAQMSDSWEVTKKELAIFEPQFESLKRRKEEMERARH